MSAGRPVSAGRAFAAFVTARPILVLALSVLAAGSLTVQIPSLRSDVSVRIFFEPDDPAITRYDSMLEHFGSDDFIILAFEVEDAFRPELIEQVRELTVALQGIGAIDEVTSLAKVETIRTRSDGLVYVGDLLTEFPPSPEDISLARRDIEESYLLRQTVVAPGARAVTVSARLKPTRDEQVRTDTVLEVRRIAESILGYRPHMVGMPVIDESFHELSDRDLGRLVPLGGAIIAALLFASFRSLAAVILPLLVVALSAGCALGALALAGGNLHTLTSAIPLIMLIVSVAGSIHLLSAYVRHLGADADRRRALREALAEVIAPCAVASATTAIGCASFGVSPMPPLTEFGLASAFGVLASGAFTLTFLPAALALLPASHLAGGAARRDDSERRWSELARMVQRRSRTILTAGAAAALVMVIGLFRLTADEDVLRNFPEEAPVPASVRFFEQSFFGVGGLQTVFNGTSGTMIDPDVVRRIDSYTRFMREHELVERSVGYPDFLRRLDQVLGDVAADGPAPDDPDRIAQYMLLLQGPDAAVARYVDDDHATARVATSVRLEGTRAHRAVEERARAYLSEHFRDLEWYLTGGIDLNFEMIRGVVVTQIRSLAFALPLMSLTIALLLRRRRLLLLILTSNVLPLGFTLGLMGHAGIPIDVGTVLVASISLGLIVDDAVYFLNGVKLHAEPTLPLGDCVDGSLRRVGPALLLTSVIGVVGFAVFGIAEFRPLGRLGLLTALAVGTAFLVNVVLLPALIHALRAYLRRDLPHAAEAAGESVRAAGQLSG